jgi:6-phosphofructokinase 2
VARAAYAPGADVCALVVVGGGSGERLVSLLDDEGVRAQPIRIAGITRECFAVLDDATGREYRFLLPGPTVDRCWTEARTGILSCR